MVLIAHPPPSIPPAPVFRTLSAGCDLFRLYNPTRFNTTALSFRNFGPLLRFDHHLASSSNPFMDPDRGVYYAGFTLSCCLVEVFGDTRLIECSEWRVAMPRLTRNVRLLDLRDTGAMRAGSVAALGKAPDHSISQMWSRYFYDSPYYAQPEGLLWYNAHNDEEAIVLYERAEDALECPPDRTIRLDDVSLRPILEQIAIANNLALVL